MKASRNTSPHSTQNKESTAIPGLCSGAPGRLLCPGKGDFPGRAAARTLSLSQPRGCRVQMSSRVTVSLKALLRMSSGSPLSKAAEISLSMAWNKGFHGEGLVEQHMEHTSPSGGLQVQLQCQSKGPCRPFCRSSHSTGLLLSTGTSVSGARSAAGLPGHGRGSLSTKKRSLDRTGVTWNWNNFPWGTSASHWPCQAQGQEVREKHEGFAGGQGRESCIELGGFWYTRPSSKPKVTSDW